MSVPNPIGRAVCYQCKSFLGFENTDDTHLRLLHQSSQTCLGGSYFIQVGVFHFKDPFVGWPALFSNPVQIGLGWVNWIVADSSSTCRYLELA